MISSTREWYQFLVLQMVSESYLHQAISGLNTLSNVLRAGSNNLEYFPDSENLPGKTRLTDPQISAFFASFEIVDHLANDASGFSATVFRRRVDDPVTGAKAGEYTLSIRSTEYQDPDKGGDWDRDGAGGADGEIFATGFALAQMAAMERYFAGLLEGRRADGSVDEALRAHFASPEGRIHVTGYSLGGHLATVFTELHLERVARTYTFNGAGRGAWNAGLGSLAEVVGAYRALMDDPAAYGTPEIGAAEEALFQAALAENPGDPAVGNVYRTARHRWALQWVSAQYRLTPLPFADADRTGDTPESPNPAWSVITQLYGHASHDDREYVANSGIHAPGLPIFIEDQPDGGGVPVARLHRPSTPPDGPARSAAGPRP